MSTLLESQVYRECLSEDEMEPITKKDQKAFCQADFSPGDSVGFAIAAYCRYSPEKLFPSLLSPSTIVFKDDRYHSGVHIAIDLGSTIHEAYEQLEGGDA